MSHVVHMPAWMFVLALFVAGLVGGYIVAKIRKGG